MKAEEYPIKFHNVTSNIGGWVGSFEFVTGVRWVFKNAKITTRTHQNSILQSVQTRIISRICNPS